MRHLKSVNQKAQRIRIDARERRRRAAAGRTAHRAPRAARLLVRVLAGLGGRQQRRHGRAVPAGRARPVRLPSHLLLAGARAGSLQPRARLDGEVRVRAEGLAQDRPDLPMSRAPLAGLVALSPRRARLPVRKGHPRARSGHGRRERHDLRRNVRQEHPRPRRSDDAGPRHDQAVGRHPRAVAVVRSEALLRDRSAATRRSRSSTSPRSSRAACSRCRTDSTKVRMWGFSLDPKERFAVLLVKTYTKKLDRYEVGKPTLLRYDLAKHAVTDTIPWPNGEEREGAQILFSPKGDLHVLLHHRRRPDLRHRIRSRKSIAGSSRGRCSRKGSAAQLLRIPVRRLRGARLLHRTVPHRPTRSTAARSWASRGWIS